MTADTSPGRCLRQPDRQAINDEKCGFWLKPVVVPNRFDKNGNASGKGCYTFSRLGENDDTPLLCEETWTNTYGITRIVCETQGMDVRIRQEEIKFVRSLSDQFFADKPDPEGIIVFEFGKCSFVE